MGSHGDTERSHSVKPRCLRVFQCKQQTWNFTWLLLIASMLCTYVYSTIAFLFKKKTYKNSDASTFLLKKIESTFHLFSLYNRIYIWLIYGLWLMRSMLVVQSLFLHILFCAITLNFYYLCLRILIRMRRSET